MGLAKGFATVRAFGPASALASALFMLALLSSPGALALPEDANQPINIAADAAQLDQKQQQAVYTGNVVVNQGTLKVEADRMVIEYRNKKVSRIICSGSPASYEQQLEGEQGRVRATAAEITYYTREERLLLNGDAILLQGGNEIRGNEIRYDIVAGRVDAESKPNQPIRMILEPDRGDPAQSNTDPEPSSE
ncbi:MAG: lipopolysaccharide transport periplasmic protein LptA [Pseudomonadota bacterium]